MDYRKFSRKYLISVQQHNPTDTPHYIRATAELQHRDERLKVVLYLVSLVVSVLIAALPLLGL